MRSFSSLVICHPSYSLPPHISIQTSTFDTHISPPSWLPCLFIAIILSILSSFCHAIAHPLYKDWIERLFKRSMVFFSCHYCLFNGPVSKIFKFNLSKFEFQPGPKLIITSNFVINVSPLTISGWEILPPQVELKIALSSYLVFPCPLSIQLIELKKQRGKM